jgi:hypothetical protein
MPSAGHCAGRTGTRFRALKNGHTPSVCQISRGAWRNLYNIARTIELRDPPLSQHSGLLPGSPLPNNRPPPPGFHRLPIHVAESRASCQNRRSV